MSLTCPSPNYLYFGDNLDVLREHVPDETVDLVYLDPPFKSDADYNVLFKTKSGDDSPEQIKAFTDTWRWDHAAAEAYEEVVFGSRSVERDDRTARTLEALRNVLGECDMLAYLAFMAVRLLELRRVMKPTASIYLHCDPTASHYLKLLMDAAFGPERYQSEVIWKRTSAHNSAKRWGPVHDTILFYSKGATFTWNPQYQPYDQAYIDEFFDRVDDDGRRYKRGDLTGSGRRDGDSGEPWRGVSPTSKGRHWAVQREALDAALVLTGAKEPAGGMTSQQKLDVLDAAGMVHWPAKEDGVPRLKQFPGHGKGVPLSDVITDVRPLHNRAAERLGYPTQKPVSLLERIIKASSNPGDLVLDPFCGCGTSVDAAQKLDRQWVGIDVTHIAVNLIRSRLVETYGEAARFTVLGQPKTVEAAQALAGEDRHEFEYWALSLVNARPASGVRKKGADGGIDGRLYFRDDNTGRSKQIVVSVKSGKNVGVKDVRDLHSATMRERAQIGALITLVPPTSTMRREAASVPSYKASDGKRHAGLQILTVEELLSGAALLDYPRFGVNESFRAAPRARREGKTGDLFG